MERHPSSLRVTDHRGTLEPSLLQPFRKCIDRGVKRDRRDRGFAVARKIRCEDGAPEQRAQLREHAAMQRESVERYERRTAAVASHSQVAMRFTWFDARRRRTWVRSRRPPFAVRYVTVRWVAVRCVTVRDMTGPGISVHRVGERRVSRRGAR